MPSTSPADLSPVPNAEAPRDCPLCPRLVRYREEFRARHPDWWNAPVPAFGDSDAWLAVVGLAPGRKGANRTGRPFTGDASGDIFYPTLLKLGLARGIYRGEAGDRLELVGTMVLNAVKCLPPDNKPSPEEIGTCSHYLEAALASLDKVQVIVALGQIAHRATARILGLSRSSTPFSHSAEANCADGRVLLSSYHPSRQNTNTGRLTVEMFEAVFERALELSPDA